MATVTRENIGLLNDKLTVKVAQEDYLPAFEKTLKQYSKTANIPGFRKGMVPAGLIKKMHGPAIFAEEVVRTVEKQLGSYLQEEKLDIFAQPISTDADTARLNMNAPEEYAFQFEIGLKPEFEVTPLRGDTELIKYTVSVTDEMVNEEVDRLQMKGGKMTDQETITSEENVINVMFDECDAAGNVIEGGIRKDNSLLVKYFSPALQKELMGKKQDDSIVFQLADSFDETRLEWVLQDLGLDKEDPAAKQKYFKLTITKIGLLEKRELDEAFFAEVYPGEDIKTEEAFRNRLREEIGKYYEQESRNRLHNDIFELLVHETPIELPASFLKKWIQTGSEKPKTAEEAEKEYPQFDHQLRWTLISDKLIRENDIRVSAEEVRENAKNRLLSYYGLGAGAQDTEWMEGYLDRLLQDEKYLDQTYRELLTQKLFDWAETRIKTKEQEVSLEEFNHLPHNHHHHEH